MRPVAGHGDVAAGGGHAHHHQWKGDWGFSQGSMDG